ncbi:hypothetical protein [Rhizobium sophoriradicis]|uniref:hypothetical protein n=1 Tax=Rhizobium sophoriradicis TaxID=1535245 RepID=UPI001481DC16|nr:hypothetical protein [Rhizobium sophoriradicis]
MPATDDEMRRDVSAEHSARRVGGAVSRNPRRHEQAGPKPVGFRALTRYACRIPPAPG